MDEKDISNLTHFFVALSERAYNENELSDVTYAMCKANMRFKQFFLDFFFHTAKLDAQCVMIEREHKDAIGQPDFYIKNTEGVIFIVEMKIWDGKHHYHQYYKILNGKKSNPEEMTDPLVWKRLGYMANYESVKDVVIGVNGEKARDLCCVATWKDFCNALSRYNSFADPIIQAYVEYVKRVCPFDDFNIKEGWKIDTDDFKAIKKFDLLVK